MLYFLSLYRCMGRLFCYCFNRKYQLRSYRIQGGDAHDRDRDASNTEENTFFVRLSERVLSLFYISFVFMDKVMKWRRVMCTSPLYPLFMIK